MDLTVKQPRLDFRTIAQGILPGSSTWLLVPLVGYLTLFFVIPLIIVLVYAVYSPEVSRALPRTINALEQWDGADLPAAETYAALAQDLRSAEGDVVIAEAARRLNYDISGFRTVLLATRQKASELTEASPAETVKGEIIGSVAQWGEARYWAAVKRAGPQLTAYYLLSALDLEIDDNGAISPVPEQQRVFVATLLRTITIAGSVTMICLLLGYPLAYALLTLNPVFASLLMFSVLLPFWTSLLVRTTAWVVVLSKQGIVNTLLGGIGLVDEPLELIYNRTGVYITMVHILLPFMVLPLLSVMRGIPPIYLKASSSLGARPLRSFVSVYLPLTMPGIGAGCMMTFIIGAGYYVTPLLVGGGRDNMISYFIASYVNLTANWGLAAAIGLILLLIILALYATIGRLVGVARIVGLD